MKSTSESQKRATKKWQDNNRANMKENSKKWYATHKEERKLVVDKYYLEVLKPRNNNLTLKEFNLFRKIEIYIYN